MVRVAVGAGLALVEQLAQIGDLALREQFHRITCVAVDLQGLAVSLGLLQHVGQRQAQRVVARAAQVHLHHIGVAVVAPFAREASGDNAIPQVLAEVCAAVCGASADQTIVQVTKVYHTGADAMERLALRPEFEGDVHTGKRYVLVDDVTSLGGTLAELGNYIQSNGGIVAGIFVLVNAGRSKSFSPDKQTLKLLEERYANELIEIFGIQANALTSNEARYLVGFRSVDEIRNRLAKAKQEIDIRLRSKGIPSLFER